MAPLQSEEMHVVPAVSFPLYTRERYTGDAPHKMQTRNGALSLKCLISTESGVTVLGEYVGIQWVGAHNFYFIFLYSVCKILKHIIIDIDN